MMRYGSVCSGIEAASVAWEPLGWQPAFFSDIEAFPRAVLKHRFPHVPLHGDFTTIGADDYGPIDLLVGGTPCQDYSIAGLRAGVDGARGNLTFAFASLAYAKRPRWIVWENVPGVFSLNGGRDFGAILATFSGRHGHVFEPPPDGWGNSGFVEPADADSYGLAWRVLDAQYTRVDGHGRAVPQRRKRVFVVGYFGNMRCAAAVFFDAQSLRRDPAPRREAGQGVAGTLDAGAAKRGQPEVDRDQLICMAHGQGGAEICSDGEPSLTCNHEAPIVAHALRAEGFDASEDGTGRGVPLWPIAFNSKDHGADASHGVSPTLRASGHDGSHANAGAPPAVVYAIQAGALRENPDSGPDGVGVQEQHAYTLEARAEVQAVVFDTTQITSPGNFSNPQPGDPCHPLAAGTHPPAIAFPERLSATQHASAENISPSLGALNPTAVAFALRGREDGALPEMHEAGDTCGALRAASGGSSRDYLATRYAVRRLTPRECERLQGFPDDWTLIPWRGKPADQCPDGPRYKALGNSMAVNVMRRIGRRIEFVEQILRETESQHG